MHQWCTNMPVHQWCIAPHQQSLLPPYSHTSKAPYYKRPHHATWTRAWRDFSISKILVRIRLISSRSPISKHETWKKISRSRLEPWDIDKKNLVLVSNPEILRKKSRSRLEPWDIDKKISFSSRNSRFREQNSRSRLEPWDWERQNLEKWKDSISFVGVVCKALIDPVARFLLPFSHSECKWLETGLNFDCQVGVWRL